MFCDEALNAVEAIAAGEQTPEGRIAEHLATCPNCSAALADATRVEALLRARPAPRAPAQFTMRTMGRVRRARWRSEQVVDAGFNLALVVIIGGVIVGIWMLLNRSGLSAVSSDAVDLLGTGLTALAQRIAPSLPLYLGAAALVGTAVGIWWWAERDATV